MKFTFSTNPKPTYGAAIYWWYIYCLQAVKRLMTFAQRKFPTDPSKCVEYEGIKT
jgi:hypothetical protein